MASETIVRKTANQSTSSASFADVADLAFSAEANIGYHFRFVVHFTTGATDALLLGVNGPASPSGLRVGAIIPSGTGAFDFGSVSAYDTAFFASTAAAAVERTAVIEGLFRCGATPGTFGLRFRSEVSQSVTILANSHGSGRKVLQIEELAAPIVPLAVGDSSAEVSAIQEQLLDLAPDPPIVVSGGFGPATRSKLKHWQRSRGFTESATVDATIWNELRAG